MDIDVAVMAIHMSLHFKPIGRWNLGTQLHNRRLACFGLQQKFGGTQNNRSVQFSAIRKSVSKSNYLDSSRRFNANLGD